MKKKKSKQMICNLVSFLVFEVFELFFLSFSFTQQYFSFFVFIVWQSMTCSNRTHYNGNTDFLWFFFFFNSVSLSIVAVKRERVFVLWFQKVPFDIETACHREKKCYLWSVPSSDLLSMQLFLQFIYFTVVALHSVLYICAISSLCGLDIGKKKNMWQN